MEVIDMDLRQRNQRSSACSTFKTIRKYSLAVCFTESLIILIFLAYILFPFNNNGNPNSDHSKSSILKQFSSENDFVSNNYRTYSNGFNTTKLLLELVSGCNQRIHDLKFSIKCESKMIESCSLARPATDDDKIKIGSILESPLGTMITTSKSGLRFFTQQVSMKQIKCKHNDPMIAKSCRFKTKLYIYPNSREQEIIGWGGALTDSSANNILSLTTNATKKLLDDYFGENGLMFNMVRITIGGSDFSSRFYTNNDLDYVNNDNDTKKEDLKLEKFRLREEDILHKIPLIKYISEEYKIKGRELKLFASMWSPPTWMKTNEHFNQGHLKGSISGDLNKKTSSEFYYKALAELKRNFLLAYKDNKIEFWGLTVMNEPLFAIQPFLDFNTMIFPGEDYANYVAKYLGPTIRNDERLKHIKLIAHDDNRRYLMNYTDPVLSNPNVRKFIDGVSVHGYTDESYDLMTEIYDKYKISDPNFFIIPTELCSGHLPFMEKALIGNWHRGFHYALDIIHSLQHSAAGWVDWNMVLDTSGGPAWLGGRLDSPIIVDKSQDAYHKSPMFYALGHFSRYIPPHSFKLKTHIINDVYDYRFETITFSLPNSKGLVSVILNQNPYPVELNLRIVEQGDIDINTDNQQLQQVICKPESITTIIHSRNAI